jgi:DNA-binding transcriptional MerR regulator/methylmalonyl-CoA mutase cobalamin-binding subunit
MATTTEAKHPIGVVSARTGLSSDVLRVWERRYAVVKPTRSAGGQRLYSDADVERLTLLNRATQGGHGISHVAGLTGSELEELVRDVESSDAPGQLPQVLPRLDDTLPAVEEAIRFTEALDPAGLESLLRRQVARHGIIAFIDGVAAPFLRSVGDAWHAGRVTVSQEHFATAVVQRIVSETAPLLTGSNESPTIVIATLEGERHANGALMAAAIAASEGWRVIYLGADLPATEIADAAVRTSARAVGISIVLPERKSRVAAALQGLAESMPAETTLLVGGTGSKKLAGLPERADIMFLESMSELRDQLARMR